MQDNNQKFVIFDLDGTLIDSFECVLRCVNKALDSFGLPHVEIPSSNRYGDIDIIFDKAKEMTSNRIDFYDFKKNFDEIHLQDCFISDYLIDTTYARLMSHYQSGLKIVILTDKFQPIAEKICRKILTNMDVVVIGREDEVSLKSHFKKVAKRLSNLRLNPYNCLCYYGDSVKDENIARMLNTKFYKYENSIIQ